MYTFYYMVNHKFTFWFESCTQIGYSVNGVFILGFLYTATGGAWLGWAASNKIAAPICGYCLGSFAILPGIPLTVPYLVAHYKFDRAFKRKEDAVLQD